MQIDRLTSHSGGRVLTAGQKQQAIDHSRQAFKLLQVGLQHLLIAVDRAGLAQHLLGLADQVVQRRSHLVGQIGREAHQLLIALVDTCQRLIQVVLKPIEFGVGTAGVQAGVQSSGIQLGCLCRELAQREQTAPADQGGKHKAEQACAEQGEDQIGAVGRQHVLALAEQVPGYQRQRLTVDTALLGNQSIGWLTRALLKMRLRAGVQIR